MQVDILICHIWLLPDLQVNKYLIFMVVLILYILYLLVVHVYEHLRPYLSRFM